MIAVRRREFDKLLVGRYPRNLAGPFRDNYALLARVKLARDLPHLSAIRVDARVLAQEHTLYFRGTVAFDMAAETHLLGPLPQISALLGREVVRSHRQRVVEQDDEVAVQAGFGERNINHG
ncbi:hypothetical protein JMJ55_30160 [Belnapia sp. T6]|uniref:Uncharacterized protein n=1 Tax=Belnapia mucosa TaxID=2804532 RepID=A0ABS1VFN9_9PROT|nr:hypothetical protein [Belnapia mucosa]MBL6459574.1 hypothetical protein [Belnapia mucosa]